MREVFSKYIPVPQRFKEGKYKYLNFDKCLEITFMGEPRKDSRPRFIGTRAVTVDTMKFVNYLKKQLDYDDILRDLFIHSPYVIEGEMYTKTTKKDLKDIKKFSKEVQKLFDKEMIFSSSSKDNDNMIKIYNDVLQDSNILITVDDKFNIAIGDVFKIASNNPRAIIRVIFSTKPDKWSLFKIQESKYYFYHLLSYKNMRVNNRDAWSQRKYLSKLIKENMDKTNPKDYEKELVNMAKYMEASYPADVIKEIAYGDMNAVYVKGEAVVMVIATALGNKYKGLMKALKTETTK